MEKNESFMLAPKNFERGDLLALDRAYIDYGKFEKLTKRGIVYVTKMKSGLSYKVVSDVMFMDQTKGMAMRIQNVTFTKKEKLPLWLHQTGTAWYCSPTVYHEENGTLVG